MAGLTKEQRAEREAQQENGGSETVLMVRSDPDHPGGPVTAEVHANEVPLWIDEGWVKGTREEV